MDSKKERKKAKVANRLESDSSMLLMIDAGQVYRFTDSNTQDFITSDYLGQGTASRELKRGIIHGMLSNTVDYIL
jgi:hypothetical protein